MAANNSDSYEIKTNYLSDKIMRYWFPSKETANQMATSLKTSLHDPIVKRGVEEIVTANQMTTSLKTSLHDPIVNRGVEEIVSLSIRSGVKEFSENDETQQRVSKLVSLSVRSTVEELSENGETRERVSKFIKEVAGPYVEQLKVKIKSEIRKYAYLAVGTAVGCTLVLKIKNFAQVTQVFKKVKQQIRD
ncbi:hypothetical protein FRX31_007275 [Thalictrum thalictroides]|uniref:Uncharacterized protein n=1 Tax=Thalictrum thalictroides TaxID=46969 RepID=A0A7J6X230_THATH|nr:hypothetical protein FRX31_007275 [Thalictrum thalictroides]